MGSTCCTLPNDTSVVPDTDTARKYSPSKSIGLTGEYKKYKLINKTAYNHDCVIFRFELPSKKSRLGLPIGNHIMLKYEDDNIDYPIIRAYTPITNDDDFGFFDLLIKIYSDGEMT
eukprot:315193_1